MGKKESQKEESIFIQEVKRDIDTFKRLKGKDRLQFVFDYYKWKIVGGITILVCIFIAVNLLIEGQKPYRLRVCAVLNTDKDCQSWFDDFYEELSKDGKPDELDLNQDQPFDYDNSYYYLQELEVMTTISSLRMDVAICGPDMYSYLLALNACADMTEVLDEETVNSLKDADMLCYDTANITVNKDGTTDDSNAVDGYFAIDLSNTSFGHNYNDGNEDNAKLYVAIIRNTKHLDDSKKLIRKLIK